MKVKLEHMLSLQDAMNNKVHPQWRDQHYAWYRAIWTECAELMDHHGWKWWQKQSPDTPQIRLEIVDIWHFGLSELLQSKHSISLIAADIEAQWKQTSPPKRDFLAQVEQLAQQCLAKQAFSLDEFCQLVTIADFSFDELYRQYVGKNVLNRFRQDNGYKSGTYRKLWNGLEDNKHLAEILMQLDSDSAEFQQDIYTALQERYTQAAAVV